MKPMNLPVMEAIMWGGRFTNKELWKSNGHINQEEAQSNPCSLSRSKLQNASWNWKAVF